MPQMRVRWWRGRYELRNATAVDLIRTAWNVDADTVVGGPDWLGTQRFDVVVTAPAGSTPEMLRAMLQAELKERFQLAIHSGSRDLPAFAIAATKKVSMRRAGGSEASGCAMQPGKSPAPLPGMPSPPVTYLCRNMTMEAFAKALPGIRETSGYLFNYPVLDRTGIDGAWDFTLRWSPRNVYWRAAAVGETITLFDAFEKQLGLRLNLIKEPAPIVVVDKAVEPHVSEAPLPHPEFEVADIKPDDPNDPNINCGTVSIQPGGRVRINMSLKQLIQEAWGAMHENRILGRTRAMDEGCWQVLAKALFEEGARAGWNGAVWNGLDLDSMRLMLRALLVDRFGLRAHMEDRPIDGYALVAAKPKLRKAEGLTRGGCREGPGPDGKDPRLTNPVASRLVTCRNMTLAQFAGELHELVPGDIPVVDATGIEGRYDLTINFSPPAVFQNAGLPESNGDPAPPPDGAISYFDALRSQLGLKLESRKVTAKVLVIDRVNLTPTAN